LQSFSTWGGAKGHEGLIGNQDKYRRVTFETLSGVDADKRRLVLEEVFLAAKVRYAVVKAKLMARNYDLVPKMGGPVEATRQALAQDGKEAKIAFMKRFYGIGPKYARNIWMDAYHPDFRDTIAVDLRIKKITKALGYSFKTFEEEERFYQDIAREAGLQGWELDRLLYAYTDHFLADISAGEGHRNTSVSRA
jgi:N-glycosylase/DNA lyase